MSDIIRLWPHSFFYCSFQSVVEFSQQSQRYISYLCDYLLLVFLSMCIGYDFTQWMPWLSSNLKYSFFRSEWSQCVVMATRHCYLWQRSFSDTLWRDFCKFQDCNCYHVTFKLFHRYGGHDLFCHGSSVGIVPFCVLLISLVPKFGLIIKYYMHLLLGGWSLWDFAYQWL